MPTFSEGLLSPMEPGGLRQRPVYIQMRSLIYIGKVTKRLVEIDDDILAAARAALGTPTIRATVEEALRMASGSKNDRLSRHLDALASHQFADRGEAWR